MNTVITTNLDYQHKQDTEKKFAVVDIIGTTKQQQLVHINIPHKKIHIEDPILYTGLVIIVNNGKGVLCIGDDSRFISNNDVIMMDENKGFRLWSTHSALNVYIIYSTQVYPDKRKNLRYKQSICQESDDETGVSIESTYGIFCSTCKK